MLEHTFEAILAKYPELIEDGLHLKGRQVSMYGRRMDLLFEDAFRRNLIVELKVGPIKDKDMGQVLSYEGMLLSADDPTIRVMLIGNRVPPNIQRALDHHGIAWKEIKVSELLGYLRIQGDSEMLGLFPLEDQGNSELKERSRFGEKTEQTKTHSAAKATFQNLLVEGYSEFLSIEQVRQLFGEKYIEDLSQKLIYLNHAKTFKLWANYIAAFLLDKEASASGVNERWFEPKDIKAKLKELMPRHYDQDGAKESSLLTADVKVGSKYHLGFPCLENKAGTRLYRFVGFNV